MDPDTALTDLRYLAAEIESEYSKGLSLDEGDVARMVCLFKSLDEWLAAGGYLPVQWAR